MFSCTPFSPFFPTLFCTDPTFTLFPYPTLFRSAPTASWCGVPPTSSGAMPQRACDATSRRGCVDVASHARCGIAPLEVRSEEHTSELQSQFHLVCRLLLEKKKKKIDTTIHITTH